MPYIVYSEADSVSAGIAEELKRIGAFESAEALDALPEALHFTSASMRHAHMIAINTPLIEAERLDGISADVLILLSRHSSAKSIPSFTVHTTGNWSSEALLGGKPEELSVAAPLYMRAVLYALNLINSDRSMAVTYEATHHGPLLNTPSLFVEIEKNSYNGERAKVVAEAVASALRGVTELPVAIGIGGTHYPQKFTELALSGKYAFSHMMPKYYVDNAKMVEKAIERSEPKASIAVIEWKSINTAQRTGVLGALEKAGIPYEKV
ncbi:MAG: D-aminoacyl-tRNA deacylase [Candidatus Micrarchaeia archaeon]